MFRLCCYSNNSLTVEKISSLLSEWSNDGWEPDAVVLDYADILAPPKGVKEKRDQINENWMHLRRVSQDFHCLVLTATQADAKSYGKRLLTKQNFSDDRRKHDHVTAMLALNALDEEKELGVMRINYLDRREAAYTESGEVWVAGCLDIGCPCMKSTR